MVGEELADSTDDPRTPGSPASAQPSKIGTNPYGTGGGGITFERKVAVRYLAHLLTGNGTSEIGEGRSVVSVGFQQAPRWPVDDLVIHAARDGEVEPSMSLMLAVRRAPNLVASNQHSRKLIRQFIMAASDFADDDSQRRWGLVVAGSQTHAVELKELAEHARVQMKASDFFELIETPHKFNQGVRKRLDHVRQLVQMGLEELDLGAPDDALVRQRTWEVLAGLEVLIPRFESPDGTDWDAVIDDLKCVSTGLDLEGASRLRDRLLSLASDYAPLAAQINRRLLRRDTHALLEKTR